MTVLEASAVLLAAGFCDVSPCDALALDDAASWVLDACEGTGDEISVGAPTGTSGGGERRPSSQGALPEKPPVLSAFRPLAEPTGLECIAVVAAILHVETAGTFVPYSSGRWVGSGVGPVGIVQPSECFRNARIGVRCFGPEELFGGASNIAAAVEILRWKFAKHRTLRSRIGAFNGTPEPHRSRYAERVVRRMR